MACYRPVPAYRTESGDVVFVERGSDIAGLLQLACGNCVGCRDDRAKMWAVRVMHEASQHEDNCFVTLTYDDEHCPQDGSLRYRDFQNFMKYTRKFFRPLLVRFYMCGEYGGDLGRPHFHAALFGVGFRGDRKFWRKTEAGARSYRSGNLERLWKHGAAEVGELTFKSAAYVARYVMKKVNGDLADAHYRDVDTGTGEITWRVPEFTRMSLRPGIGAHWFDRFSHDVFPHDRVVLGGVKYKPPRYYDILQERLESDDTLQLVREARSVRARAIGDNSSERLAVKETVARARLSFFKRGLK